MNCKIAAAEHESTHARGPGALCDHTGLTPLKLVLNAGSYEKGASSPWAKKQQNEGWAEEDGREFWPSGLHSLMGDTERSQQVSPAQSHRPNGRGMAVAA